MCIAFYSLAFTGSAFPYLIDGKCICSQARFVLFLLMSEKTTICIITSDEENMKNKLIILIISMLIFPALSCCADNLVWDVSIHPSVGKLEFKYDKEEIIVFSFQLNKIIQQIPASMFTKNGWLEFMDLNGDGYKDLIIYLPLYFEGSPISSAYIWIYDPATFQFVEEEELSGRGYVEKAKTQGCTILSYRRSATLKPFYIGEYWCFDKKKKEWKLKKEIAEHFPKLNNK